MVYARAPTQHITAHADAAAAPLAALDAPRIAIERVSPSVDHGRYPAKAIVGQRVSWRPMFSSTVMSGWCAAIGCGRCRGAHRGAGSLGNDRWRGQFTPESVGLHHFTIEAWLDVWASYRADLSKNAAAGVAGQPEIEEGIEQVLAALQREPEAGREAARLAGTARQGADLGQAARAPAVGAARPS